MDDRNRRTQYVELARPDQPVLEIVVSTEETPAWFHRFRAARRNQAENSSCRDCLSAAGNHSSIDRQCSHISRVLGTDSEVHSAARLAGLRSRGSPRRANTLPANS